MTLIFLSTSLLSLALILFLFYFVIRGELQHHLGQFWLFAQPMLLAGAVLSVVAYRSYANARTPVVSKVVYLLNVIVVIVLVGLVELWLAYYP